MANYTKNTRPELLQIIRKYNKINSIPYLRIRNYNHDSKIILVKTCEAIDKGDDAVKEFINGGKIEEKNNKDKVSIPKAISPVITPSPIISPVITPPISPKIDTPKKETRADFELRMRAIAKAKYPKDASAQLRFMIEKCDGIINGMRFG